MPDHYRNALPSTQGLLFQWTQSLDWLRLCQQKIFKTSSGHLHLGSYPTISKKRLSLKGDTEAVVALSYPPDKVVCQTTL